MNSHPSTNCYRHSATTVIQTSVLPLCEISDPHIGYVCIYI